jgi:signal-transduction protein with cAMP-binding, CBS, and nucleotidyltransferase domain
MNRSLRKFFLSIVLPSFLAISLFIVSIYVVILPVFKNNVMEAKKEMISELTNTAWSLIDEYHQEYKDSVIGEDEAMRLAALRVQRMRYGEGSKDYFWIIDTQPTMVMHPYRTDLINSNLSNYTDPRGNKLFVEAVEIVAGNNKGFIDYYWQWKDDSTRIVPKLSYVKAFKPWGWIIGTGVYLEDVRNEIKMLQSNFLRLVLLIIFIIALILIYIIRQSHKIESKRSKAQEQLLLSNQKYKSLVEASSEGTLMIIDDRIIFANQKLANLIGFEASEIMTKRADELFDINWGKVMEKITKPNKSFNFEASIAWGKNMGEGVILSISKIDYDGHVAIIVIAKEVSTKKQIERETEQLTYELQTSLLLMNQPIGHFIQPLLQCNLNESILNAAKIMTRRNQDVIFIANNEEILGVINDYDLRTRVVAEGLNMTNSVSSIMSSPIISVKEDILLYEAILMFNTMGVSHLAVKNADGRFIGTISNEEILSVQRNSLSYLVKEIEHTEDVKHLVGIVKKIPVLVKALLDSGALIQNITRIVSSVTDAITKRIIYLSIEELGSPPCKFAFIVLGSEARMEQSLATDQDNAIIFDDEFDSEEVRTYFLELGRRVNASLHETGYKLCKGEIMAQNPKWNLPLKNWKLKFAKWIQEPEPQSILETTIFYDLRYIYGDYALVNELKEFVFEVSNNRDMFFFHLAQSVVKLKIPLGMFGQIKAMDDDEMHRNLDLKKVLEPIIGFIRVYTLYNKLYATNSMQRLKRLHEKSVYSKELFDELNQSYDYLMMMRFRSQSNQLLNNEATDNVIDTKEFTEIKDATLKKILSVISNIQTKLSFDFKGAN